MKYAEKSVPGLVDVGVTHGDGDGLRTPPRWLEGVWKQFQITHLTMPNNFSFLKYAETSVPGLADVGVSHGDGDGPRTPPRWLEGVWKKFKMTNLTMPNNFSVMKYAENQSLALHMLGSPMGMGMAPELHPDGWRGSGKSF